LKSIIVIALSLLAGSYVCSAVDEPAELAVIVNKAMPSETAEPAELRLMFLGEKPKWPGGQNVIAVETPAGSPERAALLRTVYKMSAEALIRYNLQAAFTGKEIAPPKEVSSTAALKKFVASNPGAIGCLFASEVDDSVKVLKVSGASPGEPNYKLR
jgi:ABC-type phosphate transport system substrate-binding protein